MPPDAWEYPLWLVLRQASPAVRVESLAAGNASHRLFDPGFDPCAVVCLSCGPASRERYRTRFGDPVLAAADEEPGKERNLLFLAGGAAMLRDP
jgi:hypothetical protein